MKLNTTSWKIFSIFVFALGFALPAFAAKISTTGVNDTTCWWGDASFEDGCANASSAADAKARMLASMARAHKTAMQVALSPHGSNSSGYAVYEKRTADGVGN